MNSLARLFAFILFLDAIPNTFSSPSLRIIFHPFKQLAIFSADGKNYFTYESLSGRRRKNSCIPRVKKQEGRKNEEKPQKFHKTLHKKFFF
jgi:hypothetical protein